MIEDHVLGSAKSASMHLEEHLSNKPCGSRDQIIQQKGHGDANLKSGNYREAYQQYTAALDLLSKEQPRTYPGYDQLQHALLSNRSAAYTSAGRWKEGWADAVSLQACSPGWSKAWYRGGRAAEEGRQHVPALLQYAHAHQLCKDDAAGQADIKRCMLRVAARLSKPQLAQELLWMLGMQQRTTQGLVPVVQPTKPLGLLPGTSQPTTDRVESGKDQKPDASTGDGLQAHGSTQVPAVTPCTLTEAEALVVAAGQQPALSQEEVSEAGFQLVKDLMAHAGSCSPGHARILPRYVGWLCRGGIEAGEAALLRSDLHLRLKRPLLAASAAQAGVSLLETTLLERMKAMVPAELSAAAATNMPCKDRGSDRARSVMSQSEMPSVENLLDQLGHAYGLLGAALLQAAVQPPPAEPGAPDTASTSARVSNPSGMGPLSTARYKAALQALARAAELCPGNAGLRAQLTSPAVQLLGGEELVDAVKSARKWMEAFISRTPQEQGSKHPSTRRQATPSSTEEFGLVDVADTPAGATAIQQTVAEVTPAAEGGLLSKDPGQQAAVGPTRLLLQLSFAHPASRLVSAADRAQLTRIVGQRVAEVAGSSTCEARIKVQIEGLKPGRCAGDPLTVTLVVTLKGTAFDHHQAAAVLHQLAAAQGSLPSSLGTLDESKSQAHILAAPGQATEPDNVLTGSLQHVQELLLPQAASGTRPSVSEQDTDPGSSKPLVACQSAEPDTSQALVPVALGGQEVVTAPALPLPYAGYTLVDMCGRPLERPTKHPFALSRVYYSAAEVPNEEQQVWFQPQDGSCRWRQSASELTVQAIKVPPGTPAKRLQVTITARSLDVRDRVTGATYLSGRLSRGIIPAESTWWTTGEEAIEGGSRTFLSSCGDSSCSSIGDYPGRGEAMCVIVLTKMNLELHASGGWRHADTWWPRLFEGHAPVAWDDTHKEYCDLPAPVLSEHLRLEQRDAAVRAQEACERDELAALEEGDERRRQERALQLKSFG